MLAKSDIPYNLTPPYRVKTVEYTRPTTRDQRKRLIKEYDWSAPNLPAEYIYINMCTDSGTGALSDRQWSAMMLGDESYFNSKSWYFLEESLIKFSGMEYVIPSHQGRSGEVILYETLVNEGDIIPSNCHFTTTRAQCYHRGAIPHDITCPEYYDENDTSWYQGNIDTEALKKLFIEEGEKISVVELVTPNNLCAGQPISMKNIRDVRNIIDKYKKRDTKLFLDIARISENAWIIKKFEEGYGDKSSIEIVREMCSYADAIHMSAKKAGLVNMGGFVGVNDLKLYEQLSPKIIKYDGFTTYGGLAGRDLESLAVGIIEGVNDYYLEDKQRQVDVFAKACTSRGVSIFNPTSTLGVWIDAAKCLPHIKPIEGPGTALAVQAYIEGGIGITSMDSLHRGREDTSDPLNTAKIGLAPYELIRCAIPRRVYTDAHYDWCGEALAIAMQWGEKIPGYKRQVLDRTDVLYEDIGLRAFFDQYEPFYDHP